jgi:hypothetical protein
LLLLTLNFQIYLFIMGELKSSKKEVDGKGKGKGYDSQGMKKSGDGEKKGARGKIMDKVRTLHIYTHEERHGKKEPLKPHPHHMKKKQNEEEEGEGHQNEDEITETHEADRSEQGSEVDEKELAKKNPEEAKKQKQKKSENLEEEIVALDKEAALAKLKTTEAGLPEVLPYSGSKNKCS